MWITIGQGRSVEGAAWHQALLDESASVVDGLASFVASIDLTKALRMIFLHDVWRASRHFGFPSALRKLMLEAFASGRRLTYQGAVADSTDTPSAILTGASDAQEALLLALVGPLDRLQACFIDGAAELRLRG